MTEGLESGSNPWFHRGNEGHHPMTKAEIIDAVCEEVSGLSKREVGELVEAVFDTLKETLSTGEAVKISGFGNFVVRHKKARIGRNPRTKDPIEITERKVLTFKHSQVLRNALNGPDTEK